VAESARIAKVLRRHSGKAQRHSKGSDTSVHPKAALVQPTARRLPTKPLHHIPYCRKLHKEGTVVLRVTLDKKVAERCKVIQKAGFGLMKQP
jgi:hypothetical protein